MSILLSLLLAQSGPLVSPGTAPPLPSPPLEMHRPKAEAPPPQPTRLQECLTLAGRDPLAAIEVAEAWLQTIKGAPQAEPQHCLGIANNYLGRSSAAEQAFLTARDALPTSERQRKASLGAMAALAALDQQAFERADAAFVAAHGDALAAGQTELAGDIAINRSRALVGLNRIAEAEAALTEGRTSSQANPAGWLLSATLSRRQGKLAQAQAQIERAAQLMPVDPQIGLEAGVIAVLAGREASARKSWQSVIEVSPASDEAKTARAYLDQLSAGPTATTR